MGQTNKSGINASRVAASVFGVYGGFLGLEHGIGEILQGNAAVTTAQINAYAPPGLPFPFGREPAMTLLPTFLMTGILAVLTGLTIIIWSAFFIEKKRGILILYLLSILLLLVGGGFAPLFVLVLAGLAGSEIKSSFRLWQKVPAGLRRSLAPLWPWMIGTTFLITPVASVVWGYLGGMNDPSFNRETATGLAMVTGLFQLCLILLSVIAAAVHDNLRQSENPHARGPQKAAESASE